MPLIKSISGIRGTVGGRAGEGLSVFDTVKYVSAFSQFLKETYKKPVVIVGRDARPSGKMYIQIVLGTLSSLGIDVINGGRITTPTVQMAVIDKQASGGIILSASHNKNDWNALKLINHKGEFLKQEELDKIIKLAEKEDFDFVSEKKLGKIRKEEFFLDMHINKILKLDLVDRQAISDMNFSVAIDGVNSVGGRALPRLLEKLGVKEVYGINCDMGGIFSHDPEPLDKNLTDLSKLIKKRKCDVGFATDPDGDRLSILCEDGSFFNEEYVIVAVSDYVLGETNKGDTVSNLSSSMALGDVTKKHGGKYHISSVGEVSVVNKMKEVGAIIGGEGHGGVIYPTLHYGRDSLVGIALFLSFLAKTKLKVTEIKKKYPAYFISKNKIDFSPDIDLDQVLLDFAKKYKDYDLIDIDGVRVNFDKEWVHVRKSNTEPIIRIYAESSSLKKADELAKKIIKENFNL